MRNVLEKFVKEIKTQTSCSTSFFRKSCRLWDNLEIHGRAKQATDDKITWDMRFACSITKATHTHTLTHTHTHAEYVILIAFPRQKKVLRKPAVKEPHFLVQFLRNSWELNRSACRNLTMYFARTRQQMLKEDRKKRKGVISISKIRKYARDKYELTCKTWVATTTYIFQICGVCNTNTLSLYEGYRAHEASIFSFSPLDHSLD